MARMCLDDGGVVWSWQLRTVRHQRARVVSTLTDPNVLETSIQRSSESSTSRPTTAVGSRSQKVSDSRAVHRTCPSAGRRYAAGG